MTGEELRNLLATIVSIDGRNVTDLSFAAWREVIGDLPYDAAMAAVRAHFRTSTAWLTPAHIVAGARSRTSGPPPVSSVLAALPPRSSADPVHVSALASDLRRRLAAIRSETRAIEAASEARCSGCDEPLSAPPCVPGDGDRPAGHVVGEGVGAGVQ